MSTPITGPKHHRRIFPWIFFAVQLIFVLWIILGAHSGSSTHCDPTLTARTCSQVHQAGTAIGVGIIIFLWAAVDIILGVGYGIYRLARR